MTTAEPLVCTNCGARSPEAAARFCAFCGHEFPREAPPAPPSPFGDLRARFRALREHATYDRAMRHEPSTTRHKAGAAFGLLFGVVFAGVAIAMMTIASNVFPLMSVFLLIFVGVGAVLVFGSLKRMSTLSSSPTRRVAALVAGERTQVSGGGKNSSASTSYYVTLETEGGNRKEYEADAKLVGTVTPGDIGVAYFKGPFLIDFRRVAV